jgi:glycosyltransferase involved in cell wall biosynthesis|tara:strand:+ start:966 stop:2885 length:1920 start_codon:yes stop_codon:yes gene_type:complete
MKKKKIIFLTNALFIKTGLSRNLKAILKEIYPLDKYEIVHYCSGVSENDHNLDKYPWKTLGSIPSNPADIQKIQSDPHLSRMATYGGYRVEQIVKDEKPDILWCSDDIWAFPPDKFCDTKWAKHLNLISHVTIDSVPILPEAIQQAKNSNFYSWASFGEKEIKKVFDKENFSSRYNLGTVNGAVDGECYKPISKLQKSELRKKFGIEKDCTLFFYLGRNQLRKKYDSILKAFKSHKLQNPKSKSKLLFHCSWTEGWPLTRIIESLEIDPEDILTTYVCNKCKEFKINRYVGEQKDCECCGNKKCVDSSSVGNGVTDEDMCKIYGVADACISVFTSGGFEFCNAESMMCGLPLATVSYSCGSEYTACDSVFEIRHIESGECQTGFVKAEPNINDIVKFIKKIETMSEKDKNEIKVKSIKWAKERYDSKVIAAKWMEIFDSLPEVDYTDFSFDDEDRSNPNFEVNLNLTGEDFIRSLYLGYLGAEYPDEAGMSHWMQRIEQGEDHSSIASLFRNISQQNIEKQEASKGRDIEDLLPKNGKKNVLFVIKESLGDTIISLSLLEGVRKQYPKHNIIVCTDPKYFEVFVGCDFVDKMIPFYPQLEQELFVIGAGSEKNIADVFIMPTVSTQKHLNYLSNNNPEL